MTRCSPRPGELPPGRRGRQVVAGTTCQPAGRGRRTDAARAAGPDAAASSRAVALRAAARSPRTPARFAEEPLDGDLAGARWPSPAAVRSSLQRGDPGPRRRRRCDGAGVVRTRRPRRS
ncbi:hypothetical protein QJS66_20230 [Kocuria rhizophila]|nr:hypothetical protein QJS66_20230 [Kocuria rhizophila]